jgi:outer membrane protein assembly factor BamA
MLPVVLLFAGTLSAQQVIHTNQKKKLIAYPLGFYSPETRAGLGVAATLNFRPIANDSLSPVSQISLGAAFTQNKQLLLSVPFTLFLSDRRHTISGELAFNDFWYYYYGTGASNPEGAKEKYFVQSPLFRLNYLYRVSPQLYAGARWWHEDYRVTEFENAGLFSGQNKMSGKTSGPGIVLLYDTRDNIYYPSSGHYLEIVAHDQSARWGSEFNFMRYRLDYRTFFAAGNSNTIGLHLFADYTDGEVPFNQLPGIGAGRRGRGFYEGRFRDNSIWLMEAEFRHVLSERWATAVFMNYAILGKNPASVSFSRDHAGAGVGIRYAFDKQNKTNLRLDIAFPLGGGEYVTAPDGVMKIYLAVNEAF